MPLHVPATVDHTCLGQQQCFGSLPARVIPVGQSAITQSSPDAFMSGGHAGMPTHLPPDHTWVGQQQLPAVSALRTLPSVHAGGVTALPVPVATPVLVLTLVLTPVFTFVPVLGVLQH